MYYLRLKTEHYYVKRIDGTVVDCGKDDRAIYKSNKYSRFYRDDFDGIVSKRRGMHLYTCKKLKTILGLRQDTFDYCGEWFDVYDENGKVEFCADCEYYKK